MNKQRGFTLLEVMVALVFLAIVLGSMLEVMGQHSRNALHIKEATLAGWLARNKVVELQLQSPWPEPATLKGKEQMAGRQWYWQAQIRTTEDSAVRRVDVEIRASEDSDNSVVHYVGYIEKK